MTERDCVRRTSRSSWKGSKTASFIDVLRLGGATVALRQSNRSVSVLHESQ